MDLLEPDKLSPSPRSRWATNGDMRLHYLELGGPRDRRPSVIVVPGFGEDASDHESLLHAVQPRHAICVDLRGRGRSDVAERGYTLEHHVADLEAIATDAGIERFHLVTYSRGTTYGLWWALGHRDRMASLAIGDYPPAQIVPSVLPLSGFAAERVWRGRPMGERMPPAAMDALMEDAVPLECWDELGTVRQPVLLIRGGARGAMATDAVEARYREVLPQLEVVCFEGSTHDLWSPDPDRFYATVTAFLDRVDP